MNTMILCLFSIFLADTGALLVHAGRADRKELCGVVDLIGAPAPERKLAAPGMGAVAGESLTKGKSVVSSLLLLWS